MRAFPRWALAVILALAGIGVLYSALQRGIASLLIPVVLIAAVFLLYKLGPKKSAAPKIKKSAQTEAKAKGNANRQPKRIRPRSQANLRVIEGSKPKENKKNTK
ncbi:hypothetical protein QJQ58_03510 [Paenibacillus dendritiformis]|uniref:Uncharacterized protein n=1 Tax=Paenibacillus dendritiformis C454 TaxID=1131935 RepID=H3SFC8_9BACL|nr:hypothetical protein [Paenibacillus dendritiformis]EHQ62157.1 hypothetical protein PDENDC454_11165 [Paenibacillus dendritiformis C454]PZM64373.1 hypothetical protein DOE73_17200 [Paenibacillus dendritiformis]TDL54212.1 hypothetical protein E2R60_14445 [Paenibacillus dendritiformis]WGU95349.1 hypothetical protein QJQ58_03510 [Paenibacillus dendritiformis]CAH8771595.1 hypothetical protein H7S4_004330 [Paenibacillus dendritiformis]